MADPKLKTTRVVIAYSASDGYRSEHKLDSKFASTPQQVLIDAAEELARLCALFGFEAEARAAMEGAFQRVGEWRKGREAAGGGEG